MERLEKIEYTAEQYEIEKTKAERHYEQAAHTLKYYFRELWEQAGLKFSGDNEAEIEGIIEDIKQGIVFEVKAEMLKEKIPEAQYGTEED